MLRRDPTFSPFQDSDKSDNTWEHPEKLMPQISN